MIKLLIGGSPCTHWSIAQTKNRETEPEGIGWELFKNYLIAKEKYCPDYFLYENNKSMSAAIREQITNELGVEPILINSALVSAQNRQRLYWTNIPGVQQPADKGILLRDILESGVFAAEPVNVTVDGKARCLRASYYKDGIRNMVGNNIDRKTCVAVTVGAAWRGRSGGSAYEVRDDQKANALAANGHQSRLVVEAADGKTHTVYEVKDGLITIKGKQYPIKLPDGFYVFRKLTVTECKRLQTVPDDYIFPASNTQAYKMLGNGWTVDVIAHILGHTPEIKTEPVEVLSMYDGMSCGRLAMNKLGADVRTYYATEIDKYAIQTTQANFPDTVQLGDAFQVREEGWSL